jgi:hypothetical protein
MRRRVKGQKHELPPSSSVDPFFRAVQVTQEAIVEAADNLGDKVTRKSAMKRLKNKKTDDI